MKALLIALFLSPSAFAIPPPQPACPAGYCGEKAVEIAAEFDAAGGIGAEEAPFLASGDCYHETVELSNRVTHHGYALIDSKEGAYYHGGTFSFFFPKNPFENLTIEDARRSSPNLYLPNHQLDIQPGYSYSEMNPKDPTSPRTYWMKRSENVLYLLGHWGRGHRVYCRFKIHPHGA